MSTILGVKPGVRGAAGSAIAHDSAELHVSGHAVYTDDLP